jgi:hypothetical protein
MSEELARYETRAVPDTLTSNDVVGQISLIQEIMGRIMKEGEHYGKIPGCGDKPTLLKPGAEKLGLTFRLRPEYKVTRTDYANGHVQFEVSCTLKKIGTDDVWGEGLGSCSTMESKYRYRTGPVEVTGKDVPKGYWDMRKSEPGKAQELIGGKGFSVRKVDGKWEIVIQGEKADNPDIADTYNTVLKMAKKRAFVDSMITATSCSDIFTQDVEDFVNAEIIPPKEEPPKSTKPETKAPQAMQDSTQNKKVPQHTGQKSPVQLKNALVIALHGDTDKATAIINEIAPGKDAADWTNEEMNKIEIRAQEIKEAANG